MNPKDTASPLTIQIQAQLLDVARSTQKVEAMAYAFSSEARFLGSAPLNDKGEARLPVQATVPADTLRVLVGPRLSDKEPDFAELMRRGAIEQHLSYNPRLRELKADFVIYEPIWLCWLRSAVFVQGQLLKKVTIGGAVVDFPVCNATVEIYEVDPLYILIPKLPVLVLDRLRDIIANARIKDPIIAVPERVPGPIPEPGPGPLPLSVTGASLRRLNTTTLAAQSHALTADSAATLTKLSEATELRYLAQAGSALQFQQALIQNPVLIRPLLCWLFPRFVTMQRVGTAITDSCGHFRTVFFQGCHNHDTPDLYFKATQPIFGPLKFTIYAPTPVACHTWWDYMSGTEVKLYTHSPFAHTCAPCPPVVGPQGVGRWVAFLAIGGVPLSQIYGTSKALKDSTSPAVLTARRGLTADGRPWGGLLRPRLLFANELEALGVRHYQISWRRGFSGAFHALKDGIQHYYRHDVNTPSGVFPAWTPFTLGPKPVPAGGGIEVPDLTQIPYASVAPEGVWDTPPSAGEIVEHLSSAKFPTHLFAPGLSYNGDGSVVSGTSDDSGQYQLKVDLFDALGQPIDIHAQGIKFVVPDVPDLTGTIYTTDAEPLGLVVGNSMIITLHVDNNHCYAQIPAPSIGATFADDCCGVLQAQDSDVVSLPYQAWHPHGFANYSFVTVRGVRTVLNRSQDPLNPGQPLPVDDPGTPMVNEDPTGGSPATMSVHDLMTVNMPASCLVDHPAGCLVAGFSENLYVDSTATDGWSNELGYDASAVRAFVLSKVVLPTS
ncbi:MAG: hypothetical protein HY836_07825 [Aquabacterium sp.]|uniref:hypothetical protein n=1 Tax=Aquabacterium sp. TaxID=1872578 RepID=UPI0025C4FCFE|nr:hypothetical protein [Aquabacterium sp.]MBI5925496.1 hypothetical protein [Aquabacterium sp.]